MSWITIDQEKCNGCGICARRCPRCYTNKEGLITVQADEDCCNLCGHCVALCKTSAITHSRMDMKNFPPISGQISFDPDEFFQFVRQRRSHRGFRKKSVSRADLKKLVEICRYCPTGSNLQTVQIKIITNPERRQKLSDVTVDYFIEMIN
ncbi:MAG: nitroreductase family protein, partial [Deltaproteobacteria bacterium]|nr:nitroreductase family protein [Deltaproteobacteria bacterium]